MDNMCISLLLYKVLRFESATVSCNGEKLSVDVADSPLKQMLGLMHREKLAGNGGMLFVFSREARYGIWMHNMRIGIDIIWIDRHGKIIDIVEEAKPCRSIINCRTYRPREKAKYVLEIKYGYVKKRRIRIGDKIILPAST